MEIAIENSNRLGALQLWKKRGCRVENNSSIQGRINDFEILGRINDFELYHD